LVWEVPPKLEFNESYINYPAEIPIMEPLFLRERENSHLADSDTEFEFIRFLESDLMNSSIKWWYKNGTKGKEHFAIIYQNNKGTKSLFYVDFVIQFKNGILGLFDTKTINSDPEMIGKHNALIDFSQSRNIENKPTIASIVLQKNKSWWYNNKIISTFDEALSDWIIFNSSIK
jgi:type III restriction enzyme